MARKQSAPEAAIRFVDDRLGAAGFLRRSFNKVFPDHWSFMLGEIALYSFIILLLSGVYLTLWFNPGTAIVEYDGSYVPLKGVEMTQAYASSLDISFDVRGGLFMRQVHHWAALLFVAAMAVHLMRVFFTGAFRKPRELNWVIGATLLILGILEGFAGYSLPDDLLSGTGLRIGYAIMESIPVVGTYAAFFVFGGEFPGETFIARLYPIHILLIPGIILGLITAHLMMIWYQKHTQFPGEGRTEHNVVGMKFLPIYMAKAGGFFFLVFAVTALLSGLAQINPIWLFGPYNPTQVTAGSQPDWYMGFMDGAVRAMVNWETNVFGHTISWNIFLPAIVLPGLIFTLMLLYPFLEQWATGDREHHNLLDRPRYRPNRTALGAMALTFYLLLLVEGGNDIIAYKFHLSVNAITWFVRIGLIVLPPIAFMVTRRICLGLQRKDDELVHHGVETGTIKRLESGEFVEVTAPVSEPTKVVLTSRPDEAPVLVGAP
ncbi:MAG: cytochrome b, partial [Mycobacterium leprae]